MAASTVTDADLHAARAAFRAQARFDVLKGTRYRMRYVVWGSGPPLVFIHGMADHAQSFVMVMHHLADRYTCIANELPDGLTDGARLAAYRHGDYVADLLELLDHLGIARTALFGSSFGSTIAIAALAHAPGRFTHGILQGAFAHRPLSWPQRALCRAARFWSGWFSDWPEIYHRVTARFASPTLSLLTPGVMRFLYDQGGRTPIRAAALRSLTFDRLDLRPLLPMITTPVLMIGGDRDPLVPRVCDHEIETGLPNVRRVEFSPCGHYPHFSHPGPMAEAICEFLR